MSEEPEKPPLERDFDLGRLSDAGEEIVLAPKGEDLVQLARWSDVASIEQFTAKIELKRRAAGQFRYAATVEADITQNCVVTLEPIKSHVDLSFHRDLHLVRAMRSMPAQTEVLTLGAGEDDMPEEIESSHYDIAGPVLEEFSLAINPYPRAAGVAFEAPVTVSEEQQNPFAVLERLKTGL